MSTNAYETVVNHWITKKIKWENDELNRLALIGKTPKNDSWKAKFRTPNHPESDDLPELPNDWSWEPLERICEKITDGTHHSPLNTSEGDYKYITAKNIKPWGIDLNKITYVDTSTHNEIYSRCDVKKGDVLYIKDGATTGLAAVNTLDEEFSLLSSVGVFRPALFLEPKYLKHALNSSLIRDRMLSNVAGVAITRLTLTKLKISLIPLAPVEQQILIVAKIEELFSHIDAGIVALNKSKNLLKQYRQSVLKAAVTGELTKQWRQGNKNKLEPASELLGRILIERREKWESLQMEQFEAKEKVPKNDKWKDRYKEPKPASLFSDLNPPATWMMASIDQVSEVLLGKMLDKSKHIHGQRLPYLRNINVRWGTVDTHDISSMFFKDSEVGRYGLQYGDVLVCEGGEPGRASVWYEPIKNMKYQKALHRVRFFLPLNPEYLVILLEYFASTGILARYFTGSTIKHFTKDSFTGLPFPLPPLEEMSKIVSKVDEKMASIRKLEEEISNSLQRAQKTKQSILASAFSGKLV